MVKILEVITEIGLESMAQDIDGILKETSPSVEHLDEHKGPEDAIELLMKLKKSLTRLSKKEPKRLKKRAIACTSKCDEVLQKARIEKMETERELKSRNTMINNLTSELNFYRSIIRGKGVQQHSAQSISRDDKAKSDPPDLSDLIRILYPKASKWEFLGLMLRVKQNELERIESENKKNMSKCLLEMLKWWLNNIPTPSWSLVAEALKSIQENNLAEEVIKTYCSSSTKSS